VRDADASHLARPPAAAGATITNVGELLSPPTWTPATQTAHAATNPSTQARSGTSTTPTPGTATSDRRMPAAIFGQPPRSQTAAGHYLSRGAPLQMVATLVWRPATRNYRRTWARPSRDTRRQRRVAHRGSGHARL